MWEKIVSDQSVSAPQESKQHIDIEEPGDRICIDFLKSLWQASILLTFFVVKWILMGFGETCCHKRWANLQNEIEDRKNGCFSEWRSVGIDSRSPGFISVL